MSFDRPPLDITEPGDVWRRHEPGPRTRLVIEGETELVARLITAMKPTVEMIRVQIGQDVLRRSCPPESL